MKSDKILKLLLFVSLTVVFTGCDAFKDGEIHEYAETIKNLDGVWQLTTVSRNGVDITQTMDFTQFRLNLNQDGSYSIDNYLPFAVKNDGTWKVDDPQYPFNLILKESGATSEVNIKLKYPIVEGRRRIAVSVSPGCLRNTYQYVLERIENN
ncbi:MAG: hypothetical protein BGO29_01330 [Bacteroidales bacterium 36-12]|nr:MAG: hypothetical protein BGO29_01330 [Bacteroidales bacterium 36-12]